MNMAASSSPTLTLIASLLLGVIPAASGSAQSAARIGVAGTLGWTPNLAEAFARDQVCPSRAAISASIRGTVAITSVLQAELLGEGFAQPGPDCVNGMRPPPPETGPFTFRYEHYEDDLTSPPALLSLRIGAALWRPGTVTVRPYAGVAGLAEKGMWIPQAGLTITRGAGRLRFLFEAETWWYTVSKQHVEEEYLDGVKVRVDMTEERLRTITTVLRLGITSAVGRE